MYKCEYCGGILQNRHNLWFHRKQEQNEFLNGKEDEDYVVCKECGLRCCRLVEHVKVHSMTVEQYKLKYPESLVCSRKHSERTSKSISNALTKPMGEHKKDALCEFCGEMISYRDAEYLEHLQVCTQKIKMMVEGKDYIQCPECSKKVRILSRHLKEFHGWDKEKLRLAKLSGQKFISEKVMLKKIETSRAKYGTEHPWQNKDVQEKRKQTFQEKFGVDNPYKSEEVKDKIKETNIERYGVEYPMQNEEIFQKQQESAQKGPSGQEVFFDEHTCDNVVYSGYGGRFIRCKKGVKKYGRWVHDLCPDFLVLSDNVLESAKERSKNRVRMNRERHRTRYVIELLGDYYHSEKLIGVPADEHEKQIIEAYASAGIKCLTLWEHDVLGNWEKIRPMVDAWIKEAVEDMNASPIYSRATKEKIDKRKANFECPLGSGEKFKTQEKLDEWIESDKNLYKEGLVEGDDFVTCRICNKRFLRLKKHLRDAHSINLESYLRTYPASKLICNKDSFRVALENQNKEKVDYERRIVYRLPDGSYCKKRDAWLRAYGDQKPPDDSIVDAKTVGLDAGKIEGVDYVVCKICGHRAGNLKQHVRRNHNLATYDGELVSSKSRENMSISANKTWDSRGRKPVAHDSSLNKTHKNHGLTKEILVDLYCNERLSDAKIGEKFGLSEVSINYYRKKYGIATIDKGSRFIKNIGDNICVSGIVLKYGFAERTVREWIQEKRLAGIEKDGILYYSVIEIEKMFAEKKPPEGCITTDELSVKIGETPRHIRDGYSGTVGKLKNFECIGRYGKDFYWREKSSLT